MQVGSVTDIYGGSPDAAKQLVKSLDKDAFLQLFVEQLKNQDPASPQDSSSMISQMAQFSILEQLTNICADIEKIRLSREIGDAAALVGRQVKVNAADGEIDGQVEKVTISGEEVQLLIGGKGYSLDQVIEIN